MIYVISIFFVFGSIQAGIQNNQIIFDEITIVNDINRPVKFMLKPIYRGARLTIHNKVEDADLKYPIEIGDKPFIFDFQRYDPSKPITDTSCHISEPISLKSVLQTRERGSQCLKLSPKAPVSTTTVPDENQGPSRFSPVSGEDKIQFDREKIVDAEGYWADSENPSEDSYKGRYPFPKPNEKPWPTENKFLERLSRIEKTASQSMFGGPVAMGVGLTCFMSQALSRFEDVFVGRCEYSDQANKIKWTEAFGPYYVSKFHVKPSREFYRFVMNFPLGMDYGHEEL